MKSEDKTNTVLYSVGFYDWYTGAFNRSKFCYFYKHENHRELASGFAQSKCKDSEEYLLRRIDP